MMPQDDLRSELIAKGLSAYPDAYNAVRAFEDEIRKTAKAALLDHIDQLTADTVEGGSSEPKIFDAKGAPGDGRITIGQGLGLQTDYCDIRLGVKWSKADGKS